MISLLHPVSVNDFSKRIVIAILSARQNRRDKKQKIWCLENIEKKRRSGRESMARYPERNRKNWLAYKARRDDLGLTPEKIPIFKRIVISMLAKRLELRDAKKAAWYINNRALLNKLSNEWRKRNPEKVKSIREKHFRKPENIEKKRADGLRYFYENKPSINAYRREYSKRRAKSDPVFRMIRSLRTVLRRAVVYAGKSKKDGIWNFLGCDQAQFRLHLKSLFKDGMSFENYGYGDGRWVIDHKLPVSSFDHSKESEQLKCWNFSNLQPMWWRDNMLKSNKISA